jgi:hypothetical protein
MRNVRVAGCIKKATIVIGRRETYKKLARHLVLFIVHAVAQCRFLGLQESQLNTVLHVSVRPCRLHSQFVFSKQRYVQNRCISLIRKMVALPVPKLHHSQVE